MLNIQLHMYVLESIGLESKFHCSSSTLCLNFMMIFRWFSTYMKANGSRSLLMFSAGCLLFM